MPLGYEQPVHGRSVPVTGHFRDECGIWAVLAPGEMLRPQVENAVDFCDEPSYSISYAGVFDEDLNDRPLQQVTGHLSPFER